MSEPVLHSPLHGFALTSAAARMDGSAGVWANEVSNLGYISLRGRASEPDFLTAVESALGFALPVQPCTLTASGALRAFWISPDEWLIAGPRASHGQLLETLTVKLSGLHSQAVDNSGGFTQVRVLGPGAARVMTHVTVYDVERLTPAHIVGTTFGKASAYICRETSGFSLVIRRSFADYIWRYLVRAAQPYGFAVARLDNLDDGSRP